MKKEKIIRNWFEIWYIKTDHTWKEWIWSWNAFYSYENISEEEIKKQMPKIISENIRDLFDLFFISKIKEKKKKKTSLN